MVEGKGKVIKIDTKGKGDIKGIMDGIAKREG